MNRPLTGQQQIVYDFIRDKILTRGYGPTVREIGEHMHIRSPNGVMCHLRALERKGMIIRTANKSRAIELTEPIKRPSATSISVRGTIRQGACQLVEDSTTAAEFDLDRFCGGEDVFGIQISDDSLLDWEMRRGDLVIANRALVPHAGQLAIFRLAELGVQNTAVFRFLQASGQRLELQTARRGVLHIDADQAQCEGVILAVIRSFE